MDELVVINKNSKCNFCGVSKNDSLKYGPIYKLGNIRAHYYCVLLSNRLIQNGSDNEGILGFLLSDIQKELQRTSDVLCTYCKKGHATIRCAAKKCRKSFHLPCGIKGGSLHEFIDQFKSFCHLHRPVQNIPQSILKEAYKTDVICCICYEKVKVKDKTDSLWAPCCIRTWYHRFCVQKLAHSAGYFFRCAACNDVQKFNKYMQRFGIFIPQQDASWELVPNAFEDLLYRHDKCDAEICKCPDGRQKNADNTIWEIVLCGSCGSQGIHVACGYLKFLDPEWECPTCQKITQNLRPAMETGDSVKPDEGSSKLSKITEVCHKKRRRVSEDPKNSILDKRKKCRTLTEENKPEDGDDIEIDVETVEELKGKDETAVEAPLPREVKESRRSQKGGQLSEPVDEKDVEVVEVKTRKESQLQEVLAKLKPGPLSYKLSLIRKIFQPSPTKKTVQESNSLDIIELSDSDEEKEDDDVKLIEEKNTEWKAVDDFDLISPDEAEKESEEGEKDVNVEIIHDDEVADVSEKLSFSFTLHLEKWKTDDQFLTCNEISTKTGSVENVRRHKNKLDFFLPSAKGKNTHHRYSEEEVSVEDCKLDKTKSGFREEDFRIVSDDEVIVLSD